MTTVLNGYAVSPHGLIFDEDGAKGCGRKRMQQIFRNICFIYPFKAPPLFGVYRWSHYPNSVYTEGFLAAFLRSRWKVGRGGSRSAVALSWCNLQYFVRVTLKFSRRNTRSRKNIQKNNMVLTHFSSQSLPWPPPPDCSQMAPRLLPI